MELKEISIEWTYSGLVTPQIVMDLGQQSLSNCWTTSHYLNQCCFTVSPIFMNQKENIYQNTVIFIQEITVENDIFRKNNIWKCHQQNVSGFDFWSLCIKIYMIFQVVKVINHGAGWVQWLLLMQKKNK